MGGREDVEAVTAGVKQARHINEVANLAERTAADNAGDEVLRQLAQDGPHLPWRQQK